MTKRRARILIVLAAAVLLLAAVFEESVSLLFLVAMTNLASGLAVQAIGMRISLNADSKTARSAICFAVSAGILCIEILLYIAQTTIGNTLSISSLWGFIGAAVLNLIQLIITKAGVHRTATEQKKISQHITH